MRSVRLLLASGFAAGLVTMLPTAAVAQYVAPIEIFVSPNQLLCPGTVTVSGSGFDPGSEVLVEFEAEIIATDTAGPAGDFATTVRISEAPAGSHLLTVLGSSGRREVFSVAVVECLAPRALPIGRALPLEGEIAVTGVNVLHVTVVAAALLGGGATAVRLGRRRARQARG